MNLKRKQFFFLFYKRNCHKVWILCVKKNENMKVNIRVDNWLNRYLNYKKIYIYISSELLKQVSGITHCILTITAYHHPNKIIYIIVTLWNNRLCKTEEVRLLYAWLDIHIFSSLDSCQKRWNDNEDQHSCVATYRKSTIINIMINHSIG